MVSISEAFVVTKFYQYAGGVRHNRHQHTFNGSCPICREGKSWLKKKRTYYLPKKNIICCHNCGWYGSPFNWIKEVGGYSVPDLLKEIKKDDGVVDIDRLEVKTKKAVITEKLPKDSINLYDATELSFWQDNYIVQKANSIVKERRLDRAINKPKALYISLNDPVHKNRIIIPFYDSNNEVCFYQTRKILDSDKTPKYLSKVGDEKSLFGFNNIQQDLDKVFITEGPIDAFFIKNGVAVAGITQSSNLNLTDRQERQFKELLLFDRIWVLDNQLLDKTSREKTKILLETGHKVFIWPNNEYKDLNDLCIAKSINGVEPSFILENTYTKLTGLLKLSQLTR